MDLNAAVAALQAYLDDPSAPEPTGWHRSTHDTANYRRRPDGDPTQEHETS